MKDVKKLILDILSGVSQLEKRDDIENLRHYKLLPKLQKRLRKFKLTQNELDLNHAIKLFRTTDVAMEGENTFGSTIWNTDVVIKGKAVILGHLMDKLESKWRDLHQKSLENLQ